MKVETSENTAVSPSLMRESLGIFSFLQSKSEVPANKQSSSRYDSSCIHLEPSFSKEQTLTDVLKRVKLK